jgi:iron complex transport system permease protein
MTRGLRAQLLVGLPLACLSAGLMAGWGGPLDWRAALAGQGPDALILWHIRLPRLLLAVFTGSALGLAGTAVQVMLRNPLASPDIIGFGAGAAVGAAGSIALTGGLGLVVPGALSGGLVAALVILGLAWRAGLPPLALVLIGVAVSLILSTLTDLLLSLSPGIQAAETARFLTGGFSSADWSKVTLVAVALAAALPVLAWLAYWIDRLDLGDDLARAQGLNPDRIRLATALCAAVLVSVCVAVAGPLPFVAFLAGPIARRLSDQAGTVLPLAALTGALIALAAEAAASVPVSGVRLPAGLFTALVGGPVMLFLLLRPRGMS